MWNNNIIKIIIFFLLFFSIELYSEEETNNLENTLEWEDVKFSKGYQVQIRNASKKILVDEKLNDNKYKIKLPEGTYEQRIGVYNKFGKISGFSEWDKITVSKVYIPEVKTEKMELVVSPETQNIIIKGNNFSTDIKVFLKTKNDNNIIKSIAVTDEKEISITLSINQNSVGKYDLILINPRNKKVRITNFLSLSEKIEEVVINNQRAIDETIPVIDPSPIKEKVSISSFNINGGWRSILIPGWGQYYKEEKVKSVVYFTTFFTGLAYFNTLYSDYNTSKSNFESSSNLGLLLGSYQGSGAGTLVLYNYLQNEANYNDSLSKANRASQMAIGLQLIYLVNVLDALFLNSPPKEESSSGLKIITDYKVQSLGPGLPLNSQYDLGIKWNF